MFDVQKIRREAIRWHLLTTLNIARPVGCHENTALQVIQAIYPDANKTEVRRELDYLEERKLAKLDKRPDGVWWGEISRCGIDVSEYTVHCDPGISRPVKF